MQTTTNLFGVIFPVQIIFIMLQRVVNMLQQIQVPRMFSFQHNFSLGATNSADQKRLSADTNVVGAGKYLLTNLCRTRNCVAVCE